MKDRRAAGFTLLELALVVLLIALLATLVLPRLGVIRSASLDASARQLATRIQYLREEAALRGRAIRLSFDQENAAYRPEVLEETQEGPRFVPDPGALFRTVNLPAGIGLRVTGPGIVTSMSGLPSALFAADGFADPLVIHLDDGQGRSFSVVIEPARSAPRVVDRDVEAGEMLMP
jgi:type II secretory pathway pseudopilin PulG